MNTWINLFTPIAAKPCLLRVAPTLFGNRCRTAPGSDHLYVLDEHHNTYIVPYYRLRKVTIQANPFPYKEAPPTVTLELHDPKTT